MYAIVTCPTCHTQVIPMSNGRCPSCMSPMTELIKITPTVSASDSQPPRPTSPIPVVQPPPPPTPYINPREKLAAIKQAKQAWFRRAFTFRAGWRGMAVMGVLALSCILGGIACWMFWDWLPAGVYPRFFLALPGLAVLVVGIMIAWQFTPSDWDQTP